MSRRSPANHRPASETTDNRNDRSKGAASVITETTGEVFDDGSIIELLYDEAHLTNLLLCDGSSRTLARQIHHHGLILRALELEPGLRQSMTLPSGAADYGTSSKLFDSISRVFASAGFAQIADALCLFVFSSWFPEFVIEPPLLVVAGPRAEGNCLLQVLACLVRRPLPLLAPTPGALASIFAARVSPTLLINATTLRPDKILFWLASGAAASNVIVRGKFVDVCTARAIFVGQSLPVAPGQYPMLLVNVEPASESLPVIRTEERRRLSAEFQPQLLEYRLRNFDKVRKSHFDLPHAATAIRIAAGILGAAVAGAPELEAKVRKVLACQQEAYADSLWLDLRSVTIEAALARCHERDRKDFLVGELTNDVMAIFAGRGENIKIASREVGGILRSVGIAGKRQGPGFRIKLTPLLRQKVHRLARSHCIPVTAQGAAKCPECLQAATGEAPKGRSQTAGSGNE